VRFKVQGLHPIFYPPLSCFFKKSKDWLTSFARFGPNGRILLQNFMEETPASATPSDVAEELCSTPLKPPIFLSI